LQEDGRFHETKNSVQDEIPALNTKKGNISIKNPGLKLISADWGHVERTHILINLQADDFRKK